jgi:beta-lactamase class A
VEFDRTLPIKERILKRRKQDRIRLIIVLLTIFFFIGFGIVFFKLNAGKNTLTYNQVIETLPGQNSSTTDGNQVNIKESKRIDGLKNELESYIKGCNGQYGIYYINVVTNEEFGINDTDEFIAASTIKIPLNLYIFNKIKEGTIDYSGEMTYLKEDYEEGAGEIRYQKIGTKYTVKELSGLSIESSDNVAANILIRLIGKQNLKDYMKSLGGGVISYTENISCPKDMAQYMKLVYEFCNSDSVLGKDLTGYFLNTEDNSRIPALLPKNIKIAHKTGNQIGYDHDVGIIYADTPYVLSVMSKNVVEDDAYNVIANISKKVFDYVSPVKINN